MSCSRSEMQNVRYHLICLKTTEGLLGTSVHARSLQSCPTLCDPTDRSLPGSSWSSCSSASNLAGTAAGVPAAGETGVRAVVSVHDPGEAGVGRS